MWELMSCSDVLDLQPLIYASPQQPVSLQWNITAAAFATQLLNMLTTFLLKLDCLMNGITREYHSHFGPLVSICPA